MLNIYQENGYANRFAYLKGLAVNHGIDLQVVLVCAEMLGPEEDFDALVTHLEGGL
jgi:hypothetical protein|tara:strand:+ start:66 stop:233 length:168 start_codon:yes stop_codon:yes gene_type:complete